MSDAIARVNLQRLLSPASIALVGATPRPGSIAANTLALVRERGFRGDVYPVNPKYSEVAGLACHPDLASLPMVPDLVVYAISGRPLENSFHQALALGVGGIVMFAANHLAEDADPPLPQRLRTLAAAAGVPVCGGNSMGFYNYDDNVFVSFDRPPERPPGHIALIAHSGSAMTYLANNDRRFCFNYVISSGQETHATVADYLHFVLDRPSTRVIALFLESVRDAAGFVAALEKARERDIPVVIAKLGRTEKSAAQALSHSGAIVGNHDAFTALCRRHRAILVRDADELVTTAMLFATGRRPTTHGIAGILDSGGMREQMMDLAADYGVTFSAMDSRLQERLRTHLEYGLEPDNPLDAMGALGRNSEQTFRECGKAMLAHPDTGLLTVEFEFRDGFSHYPELFHALDDLSAATDKPVIAVNSSAFSGLAATAADLTHRGIPCINGIDLALRSIRNLVDHSRFLHDVPDTRPTALGPDPQKLAAWLARLETPGPRDETTALGLLRDFGFPVIEHHVADGEDEALEHARKMGFPVVIKSAAPGLLHKTEAGGVVTDIGDERRLSAVYRQLAARLGPQVLVMRQAASGVELALGIKRDPQYGPLLIVATGGTLIERAADRAVALAPVNRREAERMIRQLSLFPLLEGGRGRAGVDLDALTGLVVDFSRLAAGLDSVILEMDVNPVIVSPQQAAIVDALVIAG